MSEDIDFNQAAALLASRNIQTGLKEDYLVRLAEHARKYGNEARGVTPSVLKQIIHMAMPNLFQGNQPHDLNRSLRIQSGVTLRAITKHGFGKSGAAKILATIIHTTNWGAPFNAKDYAYNSFNMVPVLKMMTKANPQVADVIIATAIQSFEEAATMQDAIAQKKERAKIWVLKDIFADATPQQQGIITDFLEANQHTKPAKFILNHIRGEDTIPAKTKPIEEAERDDSALLKTLMGQLQNNPTV